MGQQLYLNQRPADETRNVSPKGFFDITSTNGPNVLLAYFVAFALYRFGWFKLGMTTDLLHLSGKNLYPPVDVENDVRYTAWFLPEMCFERREIPLI